MSAAVGVSTRLTRTQQALRMEEEHQEEAGSRQGRLVCLSLPATPLPGQVGPAGAAVGRWCTRHSNTTGGLTYSLRPEVRPQALYILDKGVVDRKTLCFSTEQR